MLHNYTTLLKITHNYDGVWAAIAQSVQPFAKEWKVGGPNPGGDWNFRTCPNPTRCPLSLLYNGYRIYFPG